MNKTWDQPRSAPRADDTARGRGRAAIVVLLCIVSVGIFFRTQILNGFSVLFGDRYDGVIEIAILEHWYDVLRGLAHWNVTGYFYPHPDTLGYNDGFVLYGLMYSGFRALGADPFLGSELTNVAVKVIGFFAFFRLARHVVQLDFRPALLGTVLFVIADNSFLQAGHAQMLTLCFGPVMALLLFEAAAALVAGRSAAGIAWGLGAAAWYGAWLLTGWYMAWFFSLFLLAMIPVAALCAGPGGRAVVMRTARREALALGVIAVGLGVALVPFLVVYLPTAAQTGMHPFSEVLDYAPSPLDVVNVGAGNLLYGALGTDVSRWLGHGAPAFSERASGLPPLLLAMFALGTIGAWRRRATPQGAFVLVLAVTTLVLWAAALQVGGFTAWRLIYAVVPGAKAIRATSRLQVFLDLPVTLVAAWGIAQLAQRVPLVAVASIGAVLLLEQVNVPGRTGPLVLNRHVEMRFLRAVPPPPPGCRAFYAATAQPPAFLPALDGFYSNNVAAMIVATYDHLPTINGTSTFSPPDWNFANPERPGYAARVRSYAARHHIRALCGLDFVTDTWLPPVGAPAIPSGPRLAHESGRPPRE